MNLGRFVRFFQLQRNTFLFYKIIFLSLILIFLSYCLEKQQVYVLKVIDGDTILTNIGKVRLLGINAPERYQPCYEESKDYLKNILENKNVTLEFDKYKRDRFGRYLAWVWLNNTLINLLLVKEGYAKSYIYGYEKYARDIIKAEIYAYKNSKGCLWKKSKYFGCLKVLRFEWNPEGDDEKNLNKEIVELINTCDKIYIKNWYVFDEANNVLILNDIILNRGDKIIIHSGCGINDKQNIYWCSNVPIWNNNGDTLYIYDSDGNLVLRYSYRNVF